jgi:hypothetical protein
LLLFELLLLFLQLLLLLLQMIFRSFKILNFTSMNFRVMLSAHYFVVGVHCFDVAVVVIVVIGTDF